MLIRLTTYITSASLIALFACWNTNGKQTETTNSLEAELVKTAIDSTLALDPGLNTESYLLDLGALTLAEKKVADAFCSHYANIRLTNLDSLFVADKTWKEYQYFENPVIRFDKFRRRLDGTILIQTSKYKASDGSIGTEMIFKRSARDYKCLKSKITWIS